MTSRQTALPPPALDTHDELSSTGRGVGALDGSVVGFHDGFADGDAEAVVLRAASRGVDAVEAFEEMRKMLGSDAGAVIDDAKMAVAVFAAGFDTDAVAAVPKTS